MYFSYLQEHPGLRGTPLAMMAALCNKTASMSPPPLADAAVGKGFHPWKKQSNSPEEAGSVSRAPPGASSSSSASGYPSPPHQPTSPSPNYGELLLFEGNSPLSHDMCECVSDGVKPVILYELSLICSPGSSSSSHA